LPEAQVASVLESITDAFVALDSEFRFVYINAEAERVNEKRRNEMIGRTHWEVWPDSVGSVVEREFRRVAHTKQAAHFTTPFARKSGLRWFEVRVFARSGGGVNVFYRDVSEFRQAEAEREQARQEARQSAQETQYLVTHARCLLWHGLVGETMDPPSLWWETFPADLQAAQAFFPVDIRAGETYNDAWYRARLPEGKKLTDRLASEALMTGQSDYFAEFGAVSLTGEVRYFAERVHVEPGPRRPDAVRTWHVTGVCVDITERKRAEEERAFAEAALREAERKRADEYARFVREMLYAVTEGHLILCATRTDLPAPLPQTPPPPFDTPTELEPYEGQVSGRALRRIRQQTETGAQAAGLSVERTQDLITAACEAATNAIKHAGAGQAWVRTDEQRGTVQVWVTDKGEGIAPDSLHRATLERGFSSAGTLGHGFWLMLRTCDRAYLYTSPQGTTLLLEQDRNAPRPAWL
jgi:PAS domain S-box-containing protein